MRPRINVPARAHNNHRPSLCDIAMERLALLTALLLPVTAVASIYGMNIIVSEHTHLVHLVVVLVVLLVIMMLMLQWTKRQGWW